MLLDASKSEIQLPEEADVLIVGAGAVGLMTAVFLARKGINVTVLEAGGEQVSAASQAYFENARSVGVKLDGLHLGRFRALGGTTNFWGGQLVRFDPIVFSKRDWVEDHSTWPISAADLDPFYDAVLKTAGLDKLINTDLEVMDALKIAPPPLPEDLDFFFTRWMPETNFAWLFNKEIKSLPNLKVLVNAPVASLISDNDGQHVTAVSLALGGRRRHLIRPRKIVLANGTVEIARLLKMPIEGSDKAVWHDNKWLARGYMDHVDCVVGEVTPIDKKAFHNLFDNAILSGLKYQPKIKLTEKAQRDRKLLSISAHFIFNSSISEHLANAKIFFRSLLKGRVDSSLTDLPKQIHTLLFVGFPMILRYIRYRRMYNPADQGIQLRLTSEQRMVLESGLHLRPEVDGLGMPIADVDWKVDGSEIETLATFAELLKSYFEEAGLAKVALDERLVRRDPSFIATIDDANHQMGMARMGATAEEGVVDADLKVHGTDNLFVAGAAVFPSTGFPNPTFTAMALGLRLADSLAAGKV